MAKKKKQGNVTVEKNAESIVAANAETVDVENAEIIVEETVETIDAENAETVDAENAPVETKGSKAKRLFLEFTQTFVKAESVIGLVLILLVPCFCTAWLHLPVLEQFGFSAELSLPDGLAAGSKVAGVIEKTGNGISTVKTLVDEAATITNQIASITATAQAALNATPDERAEKLKGAISNLVSSLVGQEAAAQAEQTASEVKDTASEVADTANEIAQTAQSVTDKAQNVVDSAYEANANALKIANTILGAVSSVWYLFLLLLLVAGVLLIVGVKGRYVTGIVALAISAVTSFATVIAVCAVNNMAMDALTGLLGSWISLLIPSIVAVTAWPWVTGIAAIVCLVFLSIRLKRHRAELKAAEEDDVHNLPEAYVKESALEA